MLRDARLDAGDRARAAVEADGEHRHLGVGRLERAVAAAAHVVAAREVEELPAGRGRDEHLAGVRVAQRRRRRARGRRVCRRAARDPRRRRGARRSAPSSRKRTTRRTAARRAARRPRAASSV